MRDSYDTLVDIFECIQNFLCRLRVYTEVPHTRAMTETVIKIMVELLGVLALATKKINRGRLSKYFVSFLIASHVLSLRAEKFAKRLLGEKDIESVLQRLDRLTLEESKMTGAQTLEVVHGLVKNMQVVMEGAYRPIVNMCIVLSTNPVDGKASTDDIREILGGSSTHTLIIIVSTST